MLRITEQIIELKVDFCCVLYAVLSLDDNYDAKLLHSFCNIVVPVYTYIIVGMHDLYIYIHMLHNVHMYIYIFIFVT